MSTPGEVKKLVFSLRRMIDVIEYLEGGLSPWCFQLYRLSILAYEHYVTPKTYWHPDLELVTFNELVVTVALAWTHGRNFTAGGHGRPVPSPRRGICQSESVSELGSIAEYRLLAIKWQHKSTWSTRASIREFWHIISVSFPGEKGWAMVFTSFCTQGHETQFLPITCATLAS